MCAAHRWSLWVGLTLALVLVLGAANPASAVDVPEGTAELDARVAKLIERLGADQFATREKAQDELARIGLPAFDALHDAQDHEDIEIALRARYLLRVMPISWSRDTDPLEVRNPLRAYGDQPELERRSRMDQLAGLEEGRGVPALCRLARFETSNLLAKRAALLVMNYAEPEPPEARAQLAKMITATVGLSRRPVAQWLRVFAQTLEHPSATIEPWQRLVARELELLAQFPEKTSSDTVRELLQWQVDFLRRTRREDAALAAVRRAVALLSAKAESLVEMIDWLGARQYWAEVDRLADRFAEEFDDNPLLLYLSAQARLEQGQKEQAEQIAGRAFEIEKERSDMHYVMAMQLRNRGLFDWSEREFRHVIKRNAADHPTAISARRILAEMLHDIDRELPAAEALQGIVNELDKDPMPRGLPWLEPDSVRSRMHFFYAQHFAATDRAKQRAQLETAIGHDPTDADVLIAMYRLPDADAAWREKTRALIKTATESFRSDIAEGENELRKAVDIDSREALQRELANNCNQFAWLVGNTEGDFQEAVRISRRSVELSPQAGGLWDTLGRCFYATGDLPQAIKAQQRALKFEPHSGQMRRQLELFQKTLAEKQKGP